MAQNRLSALVSTSTLRGLSTCCHSHSPYSKVDQSCDVATDSAELPPQVSLEDVSGVFYILAAFVVGAVANACLHNQGCRQGEKCASRTH